MKTQSPHHRIAGLWSLLALAGAAAPTLAQSLAIIPPVAPGLSTSVSGYAGSGSAVFGNMPTGSSNMTYRWTPGGGTVAMNPLPGYAQAFSNGASFDGLSTTLTGITNDQSANRGFLARFPNPYTNLGTVVPNADIQWAWNISADGTTVVGETRIAAFSNVQAYRWRSSSGFQILGPLPGGFNSKALATSPGGDWVVGYGDLPSSDNAFRWSSSTGMINLGWLPGPQTWSYATAVSHDGQRVGGHSNNRPFIWTATSPSTGTMTDLGVLAGFVAGEFGAMTPEGLIAFGFSKTFSPNFHHRGNIWSQREGLRDIHSWLASIGMTLPSNFEINHIKGVAWDGRSIAGDAIANGLSRGFVISNIPCLQPPVITRDVASAQYCAGSDVTLSIETSPLYTGSQSYSWSRNGVPLMDSSTTWGSTYLGTHSPTLRILTAAIADSGVYTCTVGNACGTTVTTAANVAVNSLPGVQSVAPDHFSCINGSGLINVIPTNSGPGQLTYQWWGLLPRGPFLRWTALVDGTTAFGTTFWGTQSSVLQFANAQPPAATQYYCTITNNCGSVNAPLITIYVPTAAPVIQSQPQPVTSCPSISASTTVGVGLASNAPFIYRWQVEVSPNNFAFLTDGPVTWGGCGQVSGSATATLTLTPDPVLTAESSARFRCIISNGCSYVVSNAVSMNFCPGDYNCDGGTDGDDVGAFFNDWSNAASSADLNCDGGVDFGDSDYFFDHWGNGC
ncbi:MAG: hypothetical protein NTV94_11485 [Planctomycetota bacterium]|nr:hypothetical protein [Planctomycetota bacterium]